MSRIGIDLSATRCHLIEIRPAGGRLSRRVSATEAEDTRVSAFETIPHGWAEPAALVPRLRQWLAPRRRNRRAWVTLWGVPSVQQLVRLPPAKPADLAALARREAAREFALLQNTEVTSGIIVGGLRAAPQGAPTLEVSLVAASAPDIRARLQPLADAGFVIEGVVTPALALCSMARLRRGLVPGVPVAYLALSGEGSIVAIVGDGVLLFAREIPWGYQRDDARAFDRDEFAVRLAGELRRSFLYFKQTSRAEVAQVVMCGDMPELWSLTFPLLTQINLEEVETLNSLEGIAAAALPEPAEAFRDRIAALRLAWAIAADPAPPINLVPPEIAMRRRAARARLALAGGVAAAVATSVLAYGYADRTARADEPRVRQLEQQLATLEPRARQIEQARGDERFASAQRAALEAFETEGPRLARALEALGQSTRPGVALRSLKIEARGAAWRASLAGRAVASDPAPAQAAVNQLLRALQASPYLGALVAAPELRMISGTPPPPPELRMTLNRLISGTPPPPSGSAEMARDAPGSGVPQRHFHPQANPPVLVPERVSKPEPGRPTTPLIPPGMSGIEFAVTFEIRR